VVVSNTLVVDLLVEVKKSVVLFVPIVVERVVLVPNAVSVPKVVVVSRPVSKIVL
jgi:hypothetical protein